jgi:hypothetical protein
MFIFLELKLLTIPDQQKNEFIIANQVPNRKQVWPSEFILICIQFEKYITLYSHYFSGGCSKIDSCSAGGVNTERIYSTDDSMIRSAKHQIEHRYRFVDRGVSPQHRANF